MDDGSAVTTKTKREEKRMLTPGMPQDRKVGIMRVAYRNEVLTYVLSRERSCDALVVSRRIRVPSSLRGLYGPAVNGAFISHATRSNADASFSV